MPNTIAQNLTRLQNARTAIAAAITAKGGTVASGDGYEEFVKDILTIPTTGSWAEFRNIVRLGYAPDIYPVGTILYDKWGDNTKTAMQIVGYDKYFDPTLTAQGYTHSALLVEEKLDDVIQFDAPEAWLYAETAIPTGTYRFTIPNYDTSYGGNKTYIFTSTADVPVGGQLTFTWSYNQLPTKVAGYTSNTAVNSLFNVNIAEWNGTDECVDLGTIKISMSSPDSTYGKLNHIHRARYGSNNYLQSGIRQYLNSESAANAWWQPQTIFDRPVSNYNTNGKLTKLDGDFVDVLATPAIKGVANNYFEYPSLDGTTFTLNAQYDINDKIFLLSHTEVNLSATPTLGTTLDYYVDATDTKRIKKRKSNDTATAWWLRTPNPSSGHNVRGVNSSGALNSNYANNSNGSAAACIIQ